MEDAGVKEIFNRSVGKYNIRYVKYLGDGNTNSYKTTVNNTYGDTKTGK